MGRPTRVMYNTSMAHTLRNALRPGYARVMVEKVQRRFARSENTRAESVEWVRHQELKNWEWCHEFAPALAEEAREVGAEVRARAKQLRESTGLRIGGGARIELLYFLVRCAQPEVIVETGVAAGFSSTVLLEALKRNGKGRLYSSDFPYFRAKNPEEYVGILVPEELRENWTLLVKGDTVNLPEILSMVDKIDFYHYDSDKSYNGRTYGLDIVQSKLSDDAVVMVDDISDNVFFRDYVAKNNLVFDLFGAPDQAIGVLNLAALNSRRPS